jgi:hypothetical protein
MIALPNLSPRSTFESTPRRKAVQSVSLEELVIWAYRDQRVEQMTAASLEDVERSAEHDELSTELKVLLLHGSIDSVARVQRIAELGTEIDGGGRSFSCHPDAELLHDEVCVVARTWRGDGSRIKRFGKSGDIPEWRTGEPKPVYVPVEEDSRSPVKHKIREQWYSVHGPRPRIARGEVAKVVQVSENEWDLWVRYCPITYYPPPEYAEAARKDYSDWHKAMTRLMDRVAKLRFGDYRVTGFAAPATPWVKA